MKSSTGILPVSGECCVIAVVALRAILGTTGCPLYLSRKLSAYNYSPSIALGIMLGFIEIEVVVGVPAVAHGMVEPGS